MRHANQAKPEERERYRLGYRGWRTGVAAAQRPLLETIRGAVIPRTDDPEIAEVREDVDKVRRQRGAKSANRNQELHIRPPAAGLEEEIQKCVFVRNCVHVVAQRARPRWLAALVGGGARERLQLVEREELV